MKPGARVRMPSPSGVGFIYGTFVGYSPDREWAICVRDGDPDSSLRYKRTDSVEEVAS